jgi:transporter family-2 protein
MSMLIDNFGWLGNEAIDFSGSRIGAVLCLGVALYFIHSSTKDAGEHSNTLLEEETIS